jgi:hypothetical protein
MTDDIVTRLRNSYGQGCTCFAHHSFECICVGAQWVERYVDEAADEIERLRENNEYLKNVIETLRNEARNEHS